MILSKEEKLKQAALSAGFDFCGIAKAEELVRDKVALTENIARGYHADMGFLARGDASQRANPASLLASAKSVLVTLTSYNVPKPAGLKHYRLSRYALFPDYHPLIKQRLNRLREEFLLLYPGARTHLFVDTSPVFEKAWAEKSGLGKIGKHTIFINQDIGSFVFIGGMITDAELTPDELSESFNPCQECNRCLDACPTQALKAPYVLDASRCIAYLTIESKKEIPDGLRSHLRGNLFGCDICQEVCPWNKDRKIFPERAISPLQGITDEILRNLSEDQFPFYFEGTPVTRPGFDKLKKNIEAATD